MDKKKWETLERLFFEVLETERSQRDKTLERLCEGDEELLSELRSMLDAAGDEPRLKIESRLHMVQEPEEGLPAAPSLDRYVLGEVIGSGGMGDVYRATRSDGEFQQEVAIKLLSGAIPSAAAIRRFRTERQILARLEHPNIARLLDGGTTPDGRPFLVMQLIQGLPITEFCLEANLTIHQRLELFRVVCDGVQYAHQNLVIHRDIKPSNILVTSKGEPKLLDFGIAKLLEPDENLTLSQTSTGAVLMTPESASPEQVLGEPITTATDVYSLGVLLYRMLTGKHPFGDDKPTAEKLRTWIVEGRHTRPSQAVADSTDRKAIRGELDNIVLKALRGDPSRRYRSVGEFADDITRLLNHEPIRATPDSATYRVRKFVRRNRLVVAASVVIVSLVAGSAAITATQSREIQHERDRAEEMVQVLVSLFETSDPTFDANRDTMRVSAFIEESRRKVIEDLADQPELQVRMKHVLGKVYSARGDFPNALTMLDDAFSQHRGLLERPDSLQAAMASDLGRVLSRVEGPASIPFLRESVAIQRAAHGDRHPSVGYALATLAHELEDRTEGRALLAEALAIQRGTLPDVHIDLANSLNELGVFAYLDGDFESAAAHWLESRDMLEQIRPPGNPDVMTLTNNIAQAFLQLGDVERALTINLDLLERRRGVLGDSARVVGHTHNNIAANYAALHDYPAAEASFRTALAIYEVALGGGRRARPDRKTPQTRSEILV